jgi:hypothetical protein
MRPQISGFSQSTVKTRLTRCPRCQQPNSGRFVCKYCGLRQRRKLFVFGALALAICIAVVCNL